MKSKTMFILSTVFSGVGFLLSLAIWIVNIVEGIFVLGIVFTSLTGVAGVLVALSIIFKRQDLVLAIVDIIFCGQIGGIFYLLYVIGRNKERENNSEKIENNVETNDEVKEKPKKQIVKEKVDTVDPYETLKKLKELFDQQIIDEQTYEEKKKKYVDML